MDHILPHIYTASACAWEDAVQIWGNVWNAQYVIHYQNPLSIILRLKKRAKEISDDHQAQGGPLKKKLFFQAWFPIVHTSKKSWPNSSTVCSSSNYNGILFLIGTITWWLRAIKKKEQIYSFSSFSEKFIYEFRE